ncbi:GNAT family acetyltransferase [Natrialba magadii ATCC 43099]|uniref:GNAT family acetyltransferase n=1 Tax=Natrialba magadii (strain ATCC 43099 / DSM 3394 / CCM 3739 / CIP 104546 / IAM 13178 / JCM 8861 / NBRC 102185 / NCIMB 2190 / MS3) TaxID=547559 RepID=D3T0L1_NATMM|nr:GNAT family N-acetyltransferase [Natrialba magadii]ADD06490.1 GNAT family acetyltransferase [Natrialba magadii ATCC 43099]ELY31621.1 N-acetyltransferase GCN5 [Natrialba magadii ATCC 43099]
MRPNADAGTADLATVRVATTQTELEDAFDVRYDVFVEEQDVDEELEYDVHDEPEAEAVHFVAYAADSASASDTEPETATPIGAARLRAVDQTTGKVERVAVLESHRDTGVGRALMKALEAEAREQSLETLTLHAQTHAAGFYEGLGYETYGDEFDEAGIPHVAMEHSLAYSSTGTET